MADDWADQYSVVTAKSDQRSPVTTPNGKPDRLIYIVTQSSRRNNIFVSRAFSANRCVTYRIFCRIS